MRLTIKQIQDGNYTLSEIHSEDDYHKVWTILRMTIDELDRTKGSLHDRRKLQNQMTDLVNLHEEKTKLICSVCGKGASWNTPFLVEDENGKFSIVCDTCAHEDMSGRLFTGIEQRSNWKGDLKYSSNHEYLRNKCVIVFFKSTHGGWTNGAYSYTGRYLTFGRPMPSVSAWVNGGQTAFPLTDEEILVAMKNPLFMLKKMEVISKSGMFRCTDCGGMFKETECAGYPLFAGKVCELCWNKHQAKLEKQRKNGDVCSLCGKPYGDCYC